MRIISDMENEIHELKEQMHKMKQQLKTCNVKKNLVIKQQQKFIATSNEETKKFKRSTSIEALNSRNDMLHFYTGFSSYEEFRTLFEYIKDDVPMMTYWGYTRSETNPRLNYKRTRLLTAKTSLLILLMCLRCGLLEMDLASSHT